MTTLTLCLSDDHTPGWSLHAPGVTDEQIATGDAPYILSGPTAGPSDDDYAEALRLYQASPAKYEA